MELTEHSIIKFRERVGQPNALFISTDRCAKISSDRMMLMYTSAFKPFIATVRAICGHRKKRQQMLGCVKLNRLLA